MTLTLAVVLLLLAAGAVLARRSMRRRSGIRPVWHGLVACFLVCAALGAFVAAGAAWQGSRFDLRRTLAYTFAAGTGLWTVVLFYTRRTAGGILLDWGPAWPRRWVLGWTGLMFLGGLVASLPGERAFSAGCVILGLTAAIMRHQIREAGIMTHLGLARWREIAGYAVEADGAVLLRLKHSSRKLNLRVPADRRAECVKLLEERLGAAQQSA